MAYKALVIEDDVQTQKIISDFLRDILKYQVTVCNNYRDAIMAINEAVIPYDLVTTDLDFDGQPYGTLIIEHLVHHHRGELCYIISGTMLDITHHMVIAEARNVGVLAGALVKNATLPLELHRVIPQAMKNRDEKRKQGKVKIFISYRRDDSADVTGRIYDRLLSNYDRDSIFRDIDSIASGLDFRDYIRSNVQKCDVLVAIIGKNWLTITDENGNRRLDNEDDYVRLEILSALQRGIPVIPVLVQNAAMPKAEELPEALQDLSYRNARQVRRDPDFHGDVDRLILDLDKNRRATK